MEPDEPSRKFVEMIQIWEGMFSVSPVAVIVYDSKGSKTIQFNSCRLRILISLPYKWIFVSHVVEIEVQLGRKISGSNTQFSVVTLKGEIVEIQNNPITGNNRHILVLYNKLGST